MTTTPVERPGTVAEFITIATSLASRKSLPEILQLAVGALCNLAFADAAAVYLLDHAKRNLLPEYYQAAAGDVDRPQLPPVPLYLDQQRNMRHYLAYCAFTGGSRYFASIDDCPGLEFHEFVSHDQLIGRRTRSLAVLPLRNSEAVTVGMLVIINTRDTEQGRIAAPERPLREVLEAIASHVAVTISNARLLKENRRLVSVLEHSNRRLNEENVHLRKDLGGRYDFSSIIGDSDAMRRVFALLEKIIEADATVLIQGETGTGKELIAQALHFHGARASHPLVVQNCAALPETLLESELFGYRKGAFSGAMQDKKGLIEQAHRGTLFLDEIGDMPLNLQAKLLRVLQDRVVRPLGSVEEKRVDVRVVAATHCDLQRKIGEGEFREDLYYRLSVFPIPLPPLRERRDDLPALIMHFTRHYSQHYRKQTRGMAPLALELLLRYTYPGNIRELRNIVERCVILCDQDGYILPDHLPDQILQLRGQTPLAVGSDALSAPGSLREAVEAFESGFIRNALAACNGNQTRAAGELGIARRTLIEKINRYGISRSQNFG